MNLHGVPSAYFYAEHNKVFKVQLTGKWKGGGGEEKTVFEKDTQMHRKHKHTKRNLSNNQAFNVCVIKTLFFFLF